MKKLTLSASADVIEEARELAHQSGTSVSSLFKRFVRLLAGQRRQGGAAGAARARPQRHGLPAEGTRGTGHPRRRPAGRARGLRAAPAIRIWPNHALVIRRECRRNAPGFRLPQSGVGLLSCPAVIGGCGGRGVLTMEGEADRLNDCRACSHQADHRSGATASPPTMPRKPGRSMTAATVFAHCVKAIRNDVLIERVSDTDKEFHFQNWFKARLVELGENFEVGGRNSYPDFRMVAVTDGYELKGLAYPGRDASFDSNSQVPTGFHNGRTIYYVFGRYPKKPDGNSYPVLDLVLCHGDFLNADHEYVHENRSVKGFGSYGDILIRDRKMYVVPTPFRLVEGIAHQQTLILPAEVAPGQEFVPVGDLCRREAPRTHCRIHVRSEVERTSPRQGSQSRSRPRASFPGVEDAAVARQPGVAAAPRRGRGASGKQ